MPTYKELKAELNEIAKILEKFPEQVKPRVYDLLLQEFMGTSSLEHEESGNVRRKKKVESDSPGGSRKPLEGEPRKRSTLKESYTLDRWLNLRGDKSIPSFRVFHTEKNPLSAKAMDCTLQAGQISCQVNTSL